MKICHFDAFSGISGDMTVGSLIDAGADGNALIDTLNSLSVGAAYRFEKTKRRGIAATKFHVDGGEQKAHRHLPHVVKIIEGASALSPRARKDAIDIFTRLGEAEAKVHGTSIEKVHFHEVGAVDSISDIVGACAALEMLGIDQVRCSAINVGSGLVETEHGTLPIPTPATAELLKDMPIYSKGPEMELTTPTGAAIVASLSKGFGAMPPMSISSTGFGAGTADFKVHANVLRAVIGESREAAESTTVHIIEANIDDASPQVLGYAMERLLAAGALDVALQPIFMKKNRPGSLLSIIARPEDTDKLASIVMAETTTLGVRITTAERRIQPRGMVEVQTQWGKVRMKTSAEGAMPEYDDCKALAEKTGVPLRNVIADAQFVYLKEF